jgi:hypothetical protein
MVYLFKKHEFFIIEDHLAFFEYMGESRSVFGVAKNQQLRNTLQQNC